MQLLTAVYEDKGAHLGLKIEAEIWIQHLTPHFARQTNAKACICTNELCLRAFSGTVAVQLSELFGCLSLQKEETGY